MLQSLPPLPGVFPCGALALAVLVSAALEARRAAAAECRIALGGAPAEGWLRAVRELGSSGAAPEDCAVIDVEASGEQARLVFITRDGRRAERVLEHPDELRPALLALGVGAAGEVASSLPPPGIEVGLAPAVPAAVDIEARAISSPEAPPALEARAVFALLGGMRGGVGHLLSPAFGGSAALELERWELGVNLVLEAQYFDIGGGEPPSSAATVGVSAGRREPVADLDVLFGARTMIAALNDESERDKGERGRAEVRLGTYLGGAWPRTGGLRLRADLAVDVVPHRVLGSAGTRITPWLGASVLVGVEFNGP